MAEENGQITRPLVMKMFDEFGSKFETSISSKIDSLLQTVQQSNDNQTDLCLMNSGQDENTSSDSSGFNIWTFGGKFWNVPKDFELPKKVQRRRGWELWLRGMDTVDGKKYAHTVCLQVQQYQRLFIGDLK